MENKYFSTLTVENLNFVYTLTPSKDKNMKNKKDETMLSLFDYLGIAAGRELGKRVYSTAAQFGIEIGVRKVINLNYSGNVHLYPKYFLDFYFINYQHWEKRIAESKTKVEDIILPF